MPRLDAHLVKLRELGASDLHLSTGSRPRYRIHGDLETPVGTELSSEAIRELLLEVMDARLEREWEASRDVDFAYGIADGTRFRCNCFQDSKGMGAVFRMIPDTIIPLAKLSLPAAVERLVDVRTGLVLVTGPTGSGKSTTLAAILDAINARYRRHIITIEDPIEFLHRNQRSFVSQRELGSHTPTFSDALRSAMRQDPDVILIGELRDRETMALALTAAEMGVLVFATMHTNSAAKTMNRIVDEFPHDLRDQVLAQLAASLQAVVSQLLLRRADGRGRLVAQEILLRGPGLENIIREGNIPKVVSYIEQGRGLGMQSLDSALLELVRQGTITGLEAYNKAANKAAFEEYVRRG